MYIYIYIYIYTYICIDRFELWICSARITEYTLDCPDFGILSRPSIR